MSATFPVHYCRILLSIVTSMSVRLSVGLLARRFDRISQKPYVQTSPDFRWVLPRPVAQSYSGGVATCYVLPVLWMTSCTTVIARAQSAQVGHVFTVTHPKAAPERGRSLISKIALLLLRHQDLSPVELLN